jgi:hypothetical protein
MKAAKLRLDVIRKTERINTGVARTTMADVGRSILAKWEPDKTRPHVDSEGRDTDGAGNRITRRGHRKFDRTGTPAGQDSRKVKPLRFVMAETAYQTVYTQLQHHNCTVTRALEVGLEQFARTGEL